VVNPLFDNPRPYKSLLHSEGYVNRRDLLGIVDVSTFILGPDSETDDKDAAAEDDEAAGYERNEKEGEYNIKKKKGWSKEMQESPLLPPFVFPHPAKWTWVEGQGPLLVDCRERAGEGWMRYLRRTCRRRKSSHVKMTEGEPEILGGGGAAAVNAVLRTVVVVPGLDCMTKEEEAGSELLNRRLRLVVVATRNIEVGEEIVLESCYGGCEGEGDNVCNYLGYPCICTEEEEEDQEEDIDVENVTEEDVSEENKEREEMKSNTHADKVSTSSEKTEKPDEDVEMEDAVMDEVKVEAGNAEIINEGGNIAPNQNIVEATGSTEDIDNKENLPSDHVAEETEGFDLEGKKVLIWEGCKVMKLVRAYEAEGNEKARLASLGHMDTALAAEEVSSAHEKSILHISLQSAVGSSAPGKDSDHSLEKDTSGKDSDAIIQVDVDKDTEVVEHIVDVPHNPSDLMEDTETLEVVKEDLMDVEPSAVANENVAEPPTISNQDGVKSAAKTKQVQDGPVPSAMEKQDHPETFTLEKENVLASSTTAKEDVLSEADNDAGDIPKPATHKPGGNSLHFN
jgi:hypothetical protein